MDMTENGALVALDQLMEEFFNPVTTNQRKRDIETQLNAFKELPQSTKLCLYLISNTSSQYVTMFALSTLESVINQKWLQIDSLHQDEIKDTLYNYLIEKGCSTTHFLRSKYAKLLVTVARFNWPNRYANFFDNILELLKSEPNQLVGLTLLRTTSEEFMGLQTGLPDNRKEEIKRLLLLYIPVVFELLIEILNNLGSKPRHRSTATPPPSPTHPTSTPSLSQQLCTAKFHPDSKALNKEALETVQHLFTWVPINKIPPQIVPSIFAFTATLSYAQDDDDMCVLAMCAINELLYTKCTPPGCLEIIFQLYSCTMELLAEIATAYRIETLDLQFIEKLSELLVLLIEQHWWRLELKPGFSSIDFLSLLFQLTMQLPSVQCYLRCLAVWAAFIKQIKAQNAHKFSEVFLSLIAALLKKIQFTFNYSQLNQLNQVDLDDDNETEWQVFVKTTIEIIAMLAEIAPIETFNQILVPWKISHDVYRHLEGAVDIQNYRLSYEVSETERLCYVLRDFSTLTQALARLSALFQDTENDEVSKAAFPLIESLIEKIIESACLATSIRFYNFKLGDSRLINCFIDIHSQLLASLKTWILWITQNKKMGNNNLKAIIDLTLPILHDGTTVPTKISHAAAHLFLTITNLTAPTNLVVFPIVIQFIHLTPNLRYNEAETGYIVNSAVSNLLLKPWGDLNQDDQAQKNSLLTSYFEALTRDFRDLNPSCSENRVNEASKVLPTLCHIIEYCKNYPMASKRLLYSALKPTIEHSLILFPTYVKYQEASNGILLFFINVLSALQQQLGLETTKSAVQVFLQVAVTEQQALDKLLKILQLVVESPGSAYKSFLPGILQLCMENVYPLVQRNPSEAQEVFSALLTLLYSILLHRWQYFYMSQVRMGYSPGCSESEAGPDSPQKPEQLFAVLQVFGQALVQHDINIFRQSLEALEDLNSKWKLYHKQLFKDHLLSNFISVLLLALVDKSQALLGEDIQVAVYNMASVNFDQFFSGLLPQFIQSLDVNPAVWGELLGGFAQHRDARDLPTFVQQLRKFVGDVERFRQCNI